MSGIASARRRLVLASLYVGTEGPRERAMVAAAAAALRATPSLRATVLVDALRGTRPCSDGSGGNARYSHNSIAALALIGCSAAQCAQPCAGAVVKRRSALQLGCAVAVAAGALAGDRFATASYVCVL